MLGPFSRDSQEVFVTHGQNSARQNIPKIINSRFCFFQVQAGAFAKSVFQKSSPLGFLRGW
jgi:hypothetical protein